VDTTGVQCDVINGVDPNPGDGIDESGSDIRGSQNIGGSGGVGSPGPTGAVTGGANPLSPVIGQLLGGLLSANPIASTIG
jgi:phospholipid/cholesterol/gamma-HCH transport system substrate-binding protein